MPRFTATALLSLIALFISLSTVQAAFSAGTINLYRDYVLKYNTKTYKSTTAFCTAFRNECIAVAGAHYEHHQFDCVLSQTGPSIHAFCGGIEKTTVNGVETWNKKGHVTDRTVATVAKTDTKITGQPSKNEPACLKFKKRHPSPLITCTIDP